MTQLESDRKKELPAGTTEPAADSTTTPTTPSYTVGDTRQNSLSDTPTFQTSLKEEEYAASQKFADLLWEKPKKKEEDVSTPPQAYAAATEAPRPDAKTPPVEGQRPATSLLRTSHVDEEQIINKLLSTNPIDKQPRQTATGAVGELKDGPDGSINAASIKKEIVSKPSFGELATAINLNAQGITKIETPKVIKQNGEPAAEAVNQDVRRIAPVIKESEPIVGNRPEVARTPVLSQEGTLNTLNRIETKPLINAERVPVNAERVQPPVERPSINTGFDPVVDGKKLDYVKPVGETRIVGDQQIVAKLAKVEAEPAFVADRIVLEDRARPFPNAVSADSKFKVEPVSSGNVNLNVAATKSLTQTSADLPPNMWKTEKPAFVESYKPEAPQFIAPPKVGSSPNVIERPGVFVNERPPIDAGGIGAQVRNPSNLDTQPVTTTGAFISRNDRIADLGAVVSRPLEQQNFAPRNDARAQSFDVSGPSTAPEFNKKFFEPTTSFPSEGVGKIVPSAAVGRIIQSNDVADNSAGILKSTLKQGGSEVFGTVTAVPLRNAEGISRPNSALPNGEAVTAKLLTYDAGKYVTKYDDFKSGKLTDLGTPTISKDLDRGLAQNKTMSVQEPPQGFNDGGVKPGILFPRPADTNLAPFRDPVGQIKPEVIKPFTSAPLQEQVGAGRIPNDTFGPINKIDKIVSGGDWRQPGDLNSGPRLGLTPNAVSPMLGGNDAAIIKQKIAMMEAANASNLGDRTNPSTVGQPNGMPNGLPNGPNGRMTQPFEGLDGGKLNPGKLPIGETTTLPGPRPQIEPTPGNTRPQPSLIDGGRVNDGVIKPPTDGTRAGATVGTNPAATTPADSVRAAARPLEPGVIKPSEPGVSANTPARDVATPAGTTPAGTAPSRPIDGATALPTTTTDGVTRPATAAPADTGTRPPTTTPAPIDGRRNSTTGTTPTDGLRTPGTTPGTTPGSTPVDGVTRPATVGRVTAPAPADGGTRAPGTNPATTATGDAGTVRPGTTPARTADGSVRLGATPADGTTTTDAGAGRLSARPGQIVDAVTAFEQSTQRVRQLAEGRLTGDSGVRSTALDVGLTGRVSQVRDFSTESGAGRLAGSEAGKNVVRAEAEIRANDVRAEAGRTAGTGRGTTFGGTDTTGSNGRRGAEAANAPREPQVTSFDPQGKHIAGKFDPTGKSIDVRDPQVRIDTTNPTAGIGRIPLSGSVRVTDFQPGRGDNGLVSGQDGRAIGEIGRLPGMRGFNPIADGRGFISHGEIRAPRGESHRYITGLELALILSIAGIAKLRGDSRNSAARLEGRTWAITRQNGRPLIFVDGRQTPFQPQRAFGKGDATGSAFRIMVSLTGDRAAKLSTRTMRTTDVASQSKTTDANGRGLNLGLLGRYHYLNYFGKNSPATNYYGQFRSTSYTGSMGLAFVMAASGMTRGPLGSGLEQTGLDKLNPSTMGPADRIRMQGQNGLLTPFGKFNLEAVLGSSAADGRGKKDQEEKKDDSLSALDDYQTFLARLDGYAKRKEDGDDEEAIVNRRLAFGIENLYDLDTPEDLEIVEEVSEEESTNSSPLSQVLRRPKWVIEAGQTLDGLAERFFSNADLGWLIADLNRGLIRETYIDNKRIVELQSRQEIELPVWQDIQKFNQNRKKNWTAENLVTIVVERQIDREFVESVLSKVVGAEA